MVTRARRLWPETDGLLRSAQDSKADIRFQAKQPAERDFKPSSTRVPRFMSVEQDEAAGEHFERNLHGTHVVQWHIGECISKCGAVVVVADHGA